MTRSTEDLKSTQEIKSFCADYYFTAYALWCKYHKRCNIQYLVMLNTWYRWFFVTVLTASLQEARTNVPTYYQFSDTHAGDIIEHLIF